MSDLIAAISTAPVPAAIGILRLSGPGALEAVDRVFRAVRGGTMAAAPDRKLVYGTLLDRQGRPIDQVLATVSRGPNSYTGEDTAELQCHGSPMVLTLGLEALCAAGARPAGPGEFTRRAFLNGRLDLPQAEAVGDLLEARTDAAVRTAAGQLGGALSRRVEAVYDGLVDLMAHFHAVLDYPDEDIDPFRASELGAALAAAANGLSALLETYDRGKYLVQGVPCAIVGAPNAGKSSLLNALLGYERAIVTPIPGTTRDTVEETVRLGDVLLRLIDTAGLRETDDPVERLGVERSRAALAGAELALVLIDTTQEGGADWPAARELLRETMEWTGRVVVVLSKADRKGDGWGFPPAEEAALPVVEVSAVTGEGLDELAAVIGGLFPQAPAGEAGAVLTNARQAEAARRALESVRAAAEGLALGITPDAVLTDVEGAMASLGELTGRSVREDVVERIFARFCVGK